MHYRKKQELEPQIQKMSDQKPATNQFCPDFALIFKEKHALICKLHLLVTQFLGASKPLQALLNSKTNSASCTNWPSHKLMSF